MEKFDEAQLKKLIGMLSSSFENERLVAATKIFNMSIRANASMEELFTQVYAKGTKTVYVDRIVYRYVSNKGTLTLNTFQAKFSTDVPNKCKFYLSIKQREITIDILKIYTRRYGAGSREPFDESTAKANGTDDDVPF
jgi:ribosomal 50S subunit-recycling heat shock protein